MKSLIKTAILATVAIFASWSSVVGQNTLGNVNAGWYSRYSGSGKLFITIDWDNNKSYIQPVFYWDTIYGSYGNKSQDPGPKFTDVYGNFEYEIPFLPCKRYYIKIAFTDGQTLNTEYVTYSFETNGISSPVVNNLAIVDTGYSFVDLLVDIDNKCNSSNVEIQIKEPGKMYNYWDNYHIDDYIKYFPIQIKNLLPNSDYVVKLKFSNQYGETEKVLSIKTASNLKPDIESLYSESLNFSTISCRAFIDPMNTNSTEWKVEYGKEIDLGKSTNWKKAYSRDSSGITLSNLDRNTIYFWRSVARNEFGYDEGKIMAIKTLDFGLGFENIELSDLVKIYKENEKTKVYFEHPITANVYSMDGKKVVTLNSNNTLNLPNGFYFMEFKIGNTVFTKKFII